jgi:hypothetical protein
VNLSESDQDYQDDDYDEDEEKEEVKSMDSRKISKKKAIKDAGKPAKWIPNDVSEECRICKSYFNLFRRRHHCRNCGK